jgi:hypothetical protein
VFEGPATLTSVRGSSFDSVTTTSFDVTTDLTSLFGTAIALGDFNGDNDEDLAIGVPAADVNGTRSGAVFVFLGTGSGLDRAPVTIVPDDRIDGMSFGGALHAAEFNDGSDGDELVIGAPGAVDFASGLLNELSSLLGLGDPFSFNDVEGRVYVASIPDAVVAADEVSAGTGLQPDGLEIVDLFGASLASGDFDDDGDNELVVGAPGTIVTSSLTGLQFPGAGVFYTLELNGDGTGLVNDVRTQEAVPEIGAGFGFSLTTGDLNDSGLPEVVVGAPLGSTIGSLGDLAGEVHVLSYFGDTAVPPAVQTIQAGGLPFSLFGQSVAVGDFDGDGDPEVAVGSPTATIGILQDDSAIGEFARVLQSTIAESALQELAGTVGASGEVFVFDVVDDGLEISAFLSTSIEGLQALGFGAALAVADLDPADDKVDLVANSPFALQQDGGAFDIGDVFVFEFEGNGFQATQLSPRSGDPFIRPAFGLSIAASGNLIAASSPLTIQGAILTGFGGLASGDVQVFRFEEEDDD